MSSTQVQKPLGFFTLVTLGINGTIGVGIFFAPSEVAAKTPGYTGAFVYLIAGLALWPVAFVYGRLGSRFAEDGGPYVWARIAFGNTAAFLIGFLSYVSALFSTATVASGLSEHLNTALPGLGIGQRVWAVLAVLCLASAAASGLRLSALAWSTLTVLKLLPLFLLCLVALYAVLFGELPSSAPPPKSELTAIGSALLIVLFALQGFEIVPVLAGSSTNQRAVAWATIGSLSVCMCFYTLLHALCVRALPDLAGHKTPLVDAAAFFGGATPARIVSLGQIISALGIAFGQTVTTPRYLATLGREDGLGAWIGAEDSRRVPQHALWITTAGVLVFVMREDLGGLFALSSIAVLAQYTVATLSLAALAQRGHHGVERKQRLWAIPALFGIGLIIALALEAGGIEAKELVTTVLVTALGGILLVARGRLRVRRQV